MEVDAHKTYHNLAASSPLCLVYHGWVHSCGTCYRLMGPLVHGFTLMVKEAIASFAMCIGCTTSRQTISWSPALTTAQTCTQLHSGQLCSGRFPLPGCAFAGLGLDVLPSLSADLLGLRAVLMRMRGQSMSWHMALRPAQRRVCWRQPVQETSRLCWTLRSCNSSGKSQPV